MAMNNTCNPIMGTTTSPEVANDTEPEEFTQVGNDMTDIKPISPFNFSESAQATHEPDAWTDKV
jgi:GAG-pre-integrase domain